MTHSPKHSSADQGSEPFAFESLPSPTPPPVSFAEAASAPAIAIPAPPFVNSEEATAAIGSSGDAPTVEAVPAPAGPPPPIRAPAGPPPPIHVPEEEVRAPAGPPPPIRAPAGPPPPIRAPAGLPPSISAPVAEESSVPPSAIPTLRITIPPTGLTPVPPDESAHARAGALETALFNHTGTLFPGLGTYVGYVPATLPSPVDSGRIRDILGANWDAPTPPSSAQQLSGEGGGAAAGAFFTDNS